MNLAVPQLSPGTYPALARYAELLTGPATDRGLLGPAEGTRLWDRHLLNCAAIVSLIPARARVADLGSGAGLPGVVIAILRPDLVLTLVEPMQRRCEFLLECVAELGLTDRVRVLRARAQDCVSDPGAGGFPMPVIATRALAPLPRLVPLVAPLLTPDGVVLAIKGRRAGAEIAAAASALRRHRLEAEVCQPGTVEAGSATVVLLQRREEVVP